MRKQKLSVEAQVSYLAEKGVRFKIIDASEAVHLLRTYSNFFRLTAYRKNYPKHPGGPQAGQYIQLEFAYLVDLAEIDTALRYLIVGMALDIEHYTKMAILHWVDACDEDGYQIVTDFVESRDPHQRALLHSEIARNRSNTYCGDMLDRYEDALPVWVFVELVPFGRLVWFYQFCAERFQDKEAARRTYMLLDCKTLRNACAHNSLLLNDLTKKDAQMTDREVIYALQQIPGLPKTFRKARLKNERMRQLTTLLYIYYTMVRHPGMRWQTAQALHVWIGRAMQHREYYERNKLIRDDLDFLKILIDSWF